MEDKRTLPEARVERGVAVEATSHRTRTASYKPATDSRGVLN